jgi:hypothetical protein
MRYFPRTSTLEEHHDNRSSMSNADQQSTAVAQAPNNEEFTLGGSNDIQPRSQNGITREVVASLSVGQIS